jgi:carboxymethylenebutenolidase
MKITQSEGHLAIPKTSNGGRVLVLHAWWGLNETIKTFCNRLAQEGFTAYAPDLYHGKLADTISVAEGLSTSLNESQTNDLLDISTKFLIDNFSHSSKGLAVIGFSMGAYFALDLSARIPENIRSVVVYYGTGPVDFTGSKASFLGHFAEMDEFEPPSNIEELEAGLRKAGCPVSFYTYSGTGHWFCEPDRLQAYNPTATALAWERTLSFLRETLL